MKSFTFYWQNDTWNEYKSHPDKLITYIAGEKLSNITQGDEIFVVTAKQNRLFIGGRIIASGAPVGKKAAVLKLDGQSVIDKEQYVIAQSDQLDIFRPNLSLDADAVRNLEVITAEGSIKHYEFSKTTFPQDFRGLRKLSSKSAIEIRELLQLKTSQEPELDEMPYELSDEDPEKRVLREILQRRGQPRFRNNLLDAYDRTCCVTGCKVIELLEAAHIDPHSDGGGYSTRNGLLLRSDIHTLFDQYLLTIDENFRIRISKKLINSEYKKLDMERLTMPRPSAVPATDALARRFAEFIGREANR